MPDSDKIEALQVVPGTLRERLTQLVGQQVTVYLMGVHAHRLAVTPPHPGWSPTPMGLLPPPPWCPPSPGPAPPCPGPTPPYPGPTPPPCPGPEPMMGTAVVSGVVVFAGADFLAVRVGAMPGARDVLIPYNAVGLIVPGMCMA